MTRQEFIDAVVIKLIQYHGSNSEQLFKDAESLADERAKRYPFDVETPKKEDAGNSTDPYAVDWNDAPEWANFHAVNADGRGYYYNKMPRVLKNIWNDGGRSKNSGNYINPNWRESLRERPTE